MSGKHGQETNRTEAGVLMAHGACMKKGMGFWEPLEGVMKAGQRELMNASVVDAVRQGIFANEGILFGEMGDARGDARGDAHYLGERP